MQVYLSHYLIMWLFLKLEATDVASRSWLYPSETPAPAAPMGMVGRRAIPSAHIDVECALLAAGLRVGIAHQPGETWPQHDCR